METGLRDKNGRAIELGQRVKFVHRDGASWSGIVTFEDGVVTVNYYKGVQHISNPRSWNHSHDWVSSRNWSSLVGYPELGMWDCWRRPLTDIAERWSTPEEVLDLYKKYGYYGDRIIDCEILSEMS